MIAIGGDKLSRGLTLEGLCVSYFLRASRMYDTLMQMGRWFGYRRAILDLCRLYSTAELVEWFGHITDAAEELREEFDIMEASGATPRRVWAQGAVAPVLMVTSRLKMRAARNLMLSFSGQLVETVALYRDPRKLEDNLNALKQLLSRLGTPSEVDPERRRGDVRQKWSGYLWDGIVAADVLDFLSAYKTHPDAYKVNRLLLAEFIRIHGVGRRADALDRRAHRRRGRRPDAASSATSRSACSSAARSCRGEPVLDRPPAVAAGRGHRSRRTCVGCRADHDAPGMAR